MVRPTDRSCATNQQQPKVTTSAMHNASHPLDDRQTALKAAATPLTAPQYTIPLPAAAATSSSAIAIGAYNADPFSHEQSASFEEADALAAAALAAEAHAGAAFDPPNAGDDDGLSQDARIADALARDALRADAQWSNCSTAPANPALPWPLSDSQLATDPPGRLSTSQTEGLQSTAQAPYGVHALGGAGPGHEQYSARPYDNSETHEAKTTEYNRKFDGSDRSTPLLLDPDQISTKSGRIPSIATLFSDWVRHSAWPGMGLFGESYLLFSVGTLRPIWEVLFKDCFEGHTCDLRVLHAITYSVVLGVIGGMVFVGYKANTIGRRNGSILTATLMWTGSLGLCWSSLVLNKHAELMYKSMAVFLFIFGVGVGGEYPVAAASASEKAMVELRENQAMEELEQMNRDEHSTRDGGGEVYRDEYSRSSYSRREGDKENRGKRVQLVFMMQGLGIFFNSLTIMVLLLITGQASGDEYDKNSLLAIWRATYAIGFLILSFVMLSRMIYLNESKVWVDDKKRRDLLVRSMYGGDIQLGTSTGMGTGTGVGTGTGAAVMSPSHGHHHMRLNQFVNPHTMAIPAIPLTNTVSSLSNPSVVHEYQDEAILKQVPSTDGVEDLRSSPTWLLLRNFGVRLFGASTCWLLWDVAFYGNKLFQSSFLLALTGDNTTLFQFTLAALANSFVAMLGYLGAAIVVDHPQVGRLRLQQFGFLLTGCMFVACGFLFHQLDSLGLVLLYLASSFFGQLGPNCTTFLIPAEIFPTEMRTMCHGICAASGKIGALAAAVLFNWISDVDMFLVSGYASFAALIVTFWAIPETLGLDLYELDRKWRMILDGRKADYVGAANDPKYLSFYERSKIGLQY